MKIEDVVALAQAGFTAAQIAAMNQPQIQPQPQTQIQPQPQPQPQIQPQPQPQPQIQPQPQNDPMKALLAQMGILTSTVQNMNINNSAMPQPESVDQILASIINPPKAVTTEVK